MTSILILAQGLAAGLLIAVGAAAAALGSLALALGPGKPDEWESHYLCWGVCALLGAVVMYVGAAVIP